MEQKQGLKNFSVNINPIIKKLHFTNDKLTKSERESIFQFYMEVISYLSKDL